jgi:hypothetical protein
MDGAQRIVKERHRQIDEEGWDTKHDDEHQRHELAIAAGCYAHAAAGLESKKVGVDTTGFIVSDDPWPWDGWDKRVRDPSVEDRIRMLEKAGALCAAEIDRLQRCSQS